MPDLGVIEPSDAEWSFPVVVVPKPGGHFRLVLCGLPPAERAHG